MRLLLSGFLVLHGLIHLMGFAKAFRYAELPQLKLPISPAMGSLWLLAAALFAATAVALHTRPRWWWALGGIAIVVSMVAILSSWSDAKAGALANIVVLLPVVVGFLMAGPVSLRAEYDRDVAARLVRADDSVRLVTEADLAGLPPPVQRYLRTAGVVGQPRVRNVHVRMHGRIREDAAARWMSLQAEQYNVAVPAARLFYMEATMFGVPIGGYHRYVDAGASMRVKAAGLVPVATESGGEMTGAETVTLLNDMCVMAPAMLIDPAIHWEAVDERTARATFTNAGHTVAAVLAFNDQGELVDFWSDDRRRASGGHSAMTAARWSTPISAYRAFGPFHLLSHGEARWHEPDGDFAYIELDIDDIQYNVERP
jgi:hypothetical protein